MKKLIAVSIGSLTLTAQFLSAATFTVDAGRPVGQVSPAFYGLMTEEINHSYDGGLYAELIQNRAFLDDPTTPVHWSAVNDADSAATIALDPANALNGQLTNSLRLTVTKADKKHPAGAANDGYWGIPVQTGARYRVSIFARADADFHGPVTVSIVSDDGGKVYATGTISGLTTGWKKFEVTLKTGAVVPTAKARFEIKLDRPGTIWLGMASLFPPTWKNQPNGFRKDLMQMMVDLNPKFLRFPGGNYVEGDTIETRFEWKKTLGPIEERHGHPCPWGYRSSDGLGLLEFLNWCEDMKAEPLLGIYAGYSLKGMHVNPGPDLAPFVQDALDEIEYVSGGTDTRWGAERAKNGHPAPFKLRYVEIGNEDWFDKSGSYDARFTQFYDAIKAKYPQLKLISTIGNDQPKTNFVHSRNPDMTDEHYYRPDGEFIKMAPDYAKSYDRNHVSPSPPSTPLTPAAKSGEGGGREGGEGHNQFPEIFVGEWAAYETSFPPWNSLSTNEPPTPNLKAAIGDAVFMTAMERNSDLIKMNCYAPMFVNVNPGARQWRPNLIGYDGISAYGSPSYYAIQMFSRNIGDEILATSSSETAIQGCATRDSKTGEIFLKLVNPQATAEPLNIEIKGAASVASKASATVLSGNPDDSNSITQPKKIVPVTTTVRGVKPGFSFLMPPHSIVVLKLKAKS
jgi:alpha-L-arabinofuranosidase